MSAIKNQPHLNPYDYHKYLINEYVLNKPGSRNLLKRDTSKDKTDLMVIKENHKFLWNDEDTPKNWEERLARKYYDKLFKEYCICDLSRYKENKVAMRWRVEKELIIGKGQFKCGNKDCTDEESLRTWEVNFVYLESNEKKSALVKLRLCPPCSDKLNYHSKKREVKRLKKRNSKKKSIDKSPSDEPSPSTSSSEMAVNSKSQEFIEEDIVATEALEKNAWSQPTNVEDKSREDEFDDYLMDLLL